jgi:hypothetical protein
MANFRPAGLSDDEDDYCGDFDEDFFGSVAPRARAVGSMIVVIT